MGSLESVIGTLRAEATLDSVGHFSLDESKAREKLGDFLLTDPSAYVLELVQAALMLGADSLELEIDANDTVLLARGVELPETAFERLFAALFEPADTEAGRQRRQLAIALTACRGMAPSRIRVEATCPSVGKRLELRGEEHLISTIAPGPPMLRIHLRKPWHPRRLIDFARNRWSDLPEETLLKRRCRWLSVPLSLDGKPIAQAEGLDVALLRHRVEIAGCRVEIAIDPPATSPTTVVWLHVGGVQIEELQIDFGFLPGRVLVDASSLGKNVAQSAFVRDRRFEELLSGVAAARHRAVEALLDALDRRSLKAVAGLDQALRRETLHHAADSSLGRKLATRPIWQLATTIDEKLSLEKIRDQVAKLGRLAYAVERRVGSDLGDSWGPVLLLERQDVRRALLGLLETKGVDVGARLDAHLHRRMRRAEVLRSKRQPTVGFQAFARRSFETEKLRGELGLGPPGPAQIVWIADGHLLHEEQRDLPISGLLLSVEGPFEPTKNFDGVRHPARLIPVLAELVDLLPDFIAEAAVSVEMDPDRLLAILAFLSDPEWPIVLLEAIGFRHNSVESHYQDQPSRALGLDELAPALQRVPLFKTAGGVRRSVLTLESERQHRGAIFWLHEDAQAAIDLAAPDVLSLDNASWFLLATWYGEKMLEDCAPRLNSRNARRQFLEEPRALPSLAEATVVKLELLPPAHGEIGLLDPLELEKLPAKASVDLLIDGRKLGELSLGLGVPGITAVLEHPDLVADAAWNGIESGLDSVTELIGKALIDLLNVLSQRWDSRLSRQQRRRLRPALLEALRRALDSDQTPELRTALSCVPLWPRLNGRSASMQTLMSARGDIDVVQARALPDRSAAALLAPTALYLDKGVFALAKKILGAWMNDRSQELREALASQRLAERPTMEVALAAGEALVKVPIEAPGIRGEVALRTRVHPRRLVVALLVGKRLVGRWESAREIAVEAIVDLDDLPVNPNLGDIPDSPQLQDALATVFAQIPVLADRLVEGFEGWQKGKRQSASSHALDLLLAHQIGQLDELRPEQVKGLEGLAIIPGIERKMSIAELRSHLDGKGELAWVELGVADPPPVAGRLLLRLDGFRARRLGKLLTLRKFEKIRPKTQADRAVSSVRMGLDQLRANLFRRSRPKQAKVKPKKSTPAWIIELDALLDEIAQSHSQLTGFAKVEIQARPASQRMALSCSSSRLELNPDHPLVASCLQADEPASTALLAMISTAHLVASLELPTSALVEADEATANWLAEQDL